MARRVPLAILVCLLLAGCGSSGSSSPTTTAKTAGTTTAGSAAQTGFEGVPIERGQSLAAASTTGTGVVKGIRCGPTEQLVYHIHAHLAVYVTGQSRALPGGIGIPGSVVEQSAEGPVAAGGVCIYWLHTHAPDGVIHVESPTRRVYTLGDFFDEWRQPLSGTQVAGAHGKVTAYVDGKLWSRDVRSIPLVPHAVIQLSVGSPVVPFHRMTWSGTQL